MFFLHMNKRSESWRMSCTEPEKYTLRAAICLEGVVAIPVGLYLEAHKGSLPPRQLHLHRMEEYLEPSGRNVDPTFPKKPPGFWGGGRVGVGA